MEDLPEEIESKLAKGVGAYLRATPAKELPGALRRFGSFAPKALAPHRRTLLKALDDDALRARILEWVDEGKHRLGRDEAELLRTAARRARGWRRELEAAADGSRAGAAKPQQPARAAVSEQRLEREREKARRARDDLQRLRAESRKDALERDRQLEALRREIEALKQRLSLKSAEAAHLEEEAKWATGALERERRRATRDAETKARATDKLRGERQAARREARELAARVAALEREVKRPRSRSSPAGAPRPPRARKRQALRPPKGLLEDAPEALDAWLRDPEVHLVIDGYNVTKARGGFGDLSLESQRERLVDEITKLARRGGIKATIVFDGAELPPGRTSRRRSPVAVEYSRPPEIGDDHLVARLQALPPDPVVVVTNDRELQGRARREGATIATSDQLLALLR